MKANVLWLLATMLCGVAHSLSADNRLSAARSDQRFSGEYWTTRLVTAKVKIKPGTIEGVSNYFPATGRIYAHATLIAKGPFSPFGATFTFKWFNGDRLMGEVTATHTVLDTPVYVVHGIPANELGSGNCRVELYASDLLLGKREFTVAERKPST